MTSGRRSGSRRSGARRTGVIRTGSRRGASGAVDSITITFPDVILYPIDVANLARGLRVSNAAGVPVGITQNGTNYAVDFAHTVVQGGVSTDVGANCTTWNTNFAGYTRTQSVLTAGAKTGAEWATAYATALGVLGVAGVSRVGAAVTIVGASNPITGIAMTTDESLRGMWGRQRVNFGSAGTPAPLYSAVNATVSVHVTTPATAGRVLGVYLLSTNGTRVGSMRLGYATGPTYSIAPTAFSAGQEGLGSRNGDVVAYFFPEPIAMPASVDRWMFWKTNTAAAYGVETRLHGATVVGRGDLTTNERVLIDLTTTNPAIDIFTAGAYTMTVSTTGTAYGAVGFIYELPTGGVYVGDGGLDTWLGYHGTYNSGTPSTDIGPTLLDGLTDTPRIPIPWDGCQMIALRQGANAVAATEDFGFGIYDASACTPSVYPMSPVPTLLRSIGRANASTGAGYKTVDLSGNPIDLTGVTRLGLGSCAGNIDGSIPATTITIVYTPQAGAGGTNAWLNGWVDDGRAWDDFVVERGGLGVDQQYISTDAAHPLGAPAGTWPSPYATDAGDATFGNHPRVAIRVRRAGIALAA